MDTLQKKVLGWAGFGLMVLAGIYLIVQTRQTADTATTTNTVSFSGTGKVLAKPDVALLDLSIVTQATTSKAAQDANSKKSNAVTDFLKTQGIADKDIKTTGYNIYPQYSNPRPCPTGALCPISNDTPQIVGYQVNQTTEVKVRDLTKVDDVLAGVVTAGANQINQLQLTIDNPDALKDQARQQAIQDAKDKAAILESQLGVHLGRIINFTEDNGGYPTPIYLKAGGMVGMGGGMMAPEISTGQNEITSTVTLTYQIR